jgi:crossover junction endodeoxyribonuclease RusA
MIELILPYPPSGNHRLKLAHGKFYPTSVYKRFRWEVMQILASLQLGTFPKGSRLGIKVILHPPDHRRRDLDNILKPLLDTLKEGPNRLYEDDYDLWHMEINREDVCKPSGRLVCCLWLLHSE